MSDVLRASTRSNASRQSGLRSRAHRFESCRGRKLISLTRISACQRRSKAARRSPGAPRAVLGRRRHPRCPNAGRVREKACRLPTGSEREHGRKPCLPEHGGSHLCAARFRAGRPGSAAASRSRQHGLAQARRRVTSQQRREAPGPTSSTAIIGHSIRAVMPSKSHLRRRDYARCYGAASRASGADGHAPIAECVGPRRAGEARRAHEPGVTDHHVRARTVRHRLPFGLGVAASAVNPRSRSMIAMARYSVLTSTRRHSTFLDGSVVGAVAVGVVDHPDSIRPLRPAEADERKGKSLSRATRSSRRGALSRESGAPS